MRQTLWSIVFPLVLAGIAAHGVLGYRLDAIEGHLDRARTQIVMDVAGTALKAHAHSVAAAVQHHRDNWERRAERAAGDALLIRQLRDSASDSGTRGGGGRATLLREIVERIGNEVDEGGDLISLMVYDTRGEILARSPEGGYGPPSTGEGRDGSVFEAHPDADGRQAPAGDGQEGRVIEVYPDGTITARSPIEEAQTGTRLGWLEVRYGPDAVHRPILRVAASLGDRGHAHLWAPEARRAIAQAPVAGGDPTQAAEERALRIRNDVQRLENVPERRQGVMASGDHVLGYAWLDEDPREPGVAPWAVLLYRDTEEIAFTVSSLRVIRDSLEDWRLLLYGGLAAIAVVSLILARITRETPETGRRSVPGRAAPP